MQGLYDDGRWKYMRAGLGHTRNDGSGYVIHTKTGMGHSIHAIGWVNRAQTSRVICRARSWLVIGYTHRNIEHTKNVE